MARYKWDSASAWLGHKIDEAAGKNDVAELVSICNTLMTHVDNDDIQDDFQHEMDGDGFFRDLEIARNLTVEQCEQLLEDNGIESNAYDDEGHLRLSLDQLSALIQENIDNGIIAYDDVERLAH